MKTNKYLFKSFSFLLAFAFLFSLATLSIQAGNDWGFEPEPDPIDEDDDEDAGDGVLPCGVMPSDSTSYGFPYVIILSDGTILTE